MEKTKTIARVEMVDEIDTTACQYFIDAKNSSSDIRYLHPDLQSCTTNGIYVYQEEIMKFLTDLIGYTIEQADVVRSAISKKKLDVIQKTFEDIRSVLPGRGWNDEQIKVVCQQIQAFAKYSFNRSHSRCYADLGYITMYLKHHHNLEWWASVLNTADSEKKVRHFVSLLGDMIKPPSMADPSKRFEIKDQSIVAPASIIRGIGPATIDELVLKGPFHSIEDFVDKIDHRKCNIGHVSSLIKARAADDLMDSGIMCLDYSTARHDLMKRYEKRRKSSKFKPELYTTDAVSIFLHEREYNQCFNKSLFGDIDVRKTIMETMPDLEETGNEGVPFFFFGLPIIRDLHVAAGMVRKGVTDKEIGMILLFEESEMKRGKSKKTGKPYELLKVQLSDGYSSVEAVSWNMSKALGWKKDSLVYVRGTLKEGWKNPVSINIREIRYLDKEEK